MLGVLEAAVQWLAARGVEAPRRSTELLIGRVLGLDRLHLYLAHDRPLSESERATLRGLVARRGRHEPVAYLLGDQEFFGRTLEVTPAVLIPRPETEGLVALALEHGDALERQVRETRPDRTRTHGAPAPEVDVALRVVDLGTGSGAIAITLALERPRWQVWATDVSRAALEVARRNVARHGLATRVHLFEGSYWQPLAGMAPFDLCVSNPPYIDPEGPDPVAHDVRTFEPGVALWTPPGRPAHAYAEILAGARTGLGRGGRLLCETGGTAAPAALSLLRSSDLVRDAALENDLEGRPRYLVATRT